MSETSHCATCGAPLDGGVPDGLCAACLFGVGMVAEEKDDLGEVDIIAERPGDRVGSYHLEARIGQGAFGVVFRARQERPVRRVVAVKIIKPGMDSREVVTRFEAERQALAMMNHPHIARVHDAGTTERGRPYFVMELVEGAPLTEFCDQHDLGMRERLELFIELCEAVQHAHQKGIIHRDLKPGNVLVSMDAEGQVTPKVIDFGVAKAINMELTDKTFFTVFGQMMGTPQYMSPEQTDLNAVDVDTRSDIYSLGVLLYELVTGEVPIESDKLTSAGFDEMRRLIREEEPARPSTRIGALPVPRLEAAAGRRGLDPGKFARHLRGDLDWVVMKALEKDRTRRYETAQGLANDVRNFLENQPVNAGPPGAAYRLRKFAMRNRGPVLAAGLVLLTLVVGIIMTNNERLATDVARQKAVEAQLAELREKNKKEIEHLKLLVEGVWNWREAQPGSRGRAMDALATVGLTDLEALGLGDEENTTMRSNARNAVFACMLWTDLEEEGLWSDLPVGWSPASLDEAHRRAVVGLGGGRVAVREVGSGRILAERTEPELVEGGILEISPDGSLVALALDGGEKRGWRLMVWDWEAGTEHVMPVNGVNSAFGFLPDSRGVLIGTAAETLELVQADGKTRRSVPLGRGEPMLLDAAPGGRLVAVGYGNATLEVLDLEDGRPVVARSNVSVSALDWSPDAQFVVGGTNQGEVFVFHAAEATLEMLEQRHSKRVEQVAWSHDGRLMASGSRDEVWLWDGRQRIKLTEYAAWARRLTFSLNDSSLGPVTPENDGKGHAVLRVQRSEACWGAMGHPGHQIIASAWLFHGGVLVTGAADGLRFWNKTGALLAHQPDVPVQPGGIVAAGEDLLYLAEKDGVYRLQCGLAEGHLECGELEQFAEVAEGQQVAVSNDGGLLALARDREVVLIGVASRALVGEPLEAPAGTAFVSLSPDGHWLAAGTRGGSGVRLWNLGNPDDAPLDLPVEGSATVAFFPLVEIERDGVVQQVPPMLLTGDAEAYRLWILMPEHGWIERVAHPNDMANPEGEVAKMAFSPRATVAVVSYNRRFLQILHPRDLTVLAQPIFDRQWPLTVDPFGRRMATASTNGRLFIWNFERARKELEGCGLDWPFDPFDPDAAPMVQPPGIRGGKRGK